MATVAAIVIPACAPKSQESCGYVQNSYSERVSWRSDLPITMYIHESVPPHLRGAIESAMKTWEKAAGRKLFNIAQKIVGGPSNPSQDRYNVIYFQSSWEADKPSEQARTNLYWVGDQIVEGDININGKFTYYWNQQTSGTSYNIEALVLHELGHVLGLKHNDHTDSVMASYLASHSDRLTPTRADLSSLKCEY